MTAAHLVPHFALRLTFDLALALTAWALELPHFAEHAPQPAAACFGEHLPAAQQPAMAALPARAAVVTTAEASTRESWEEILLIGCPLKLKARSHRSRRAVSPFGGRRHVGVLAASLLPEAIRRQQQAGYGARNKKRRHGLRRHAAPALEGQALGRNQLPVN